MNTERLYAVLVNLFFFFDNKNKMNISRGSTFSLQPLLTLVSKAGPEQQVCVRIIYTETTSRKAK